MGGTTLAAEWTIREVLNWTRGYFEKAGIVQPRLEAEILLAHALHVDRLHLYLAPDKPLTSDERTRYRTIIQERRSGIPLQHVIGEVTFFGLRFRVRRDALIPRPETEEMLDRVLRLLPRDRPVRCLDMGTGCGVIAICLARYLSQARVTAVDLSPGALDLARENAELNDVSDRIDLVESDWFARIDGTFDLIASNPPYIDEREIDSLPREVRDHEPRAALDGGKGGTERISSIARGARSHLRVGGHLVMEIGHDQGERVRSVLEEAGLVDVAIKADLAGRERFAVARCP